MKGEITAAIIAMLAIVVVAENTWNPDNPDYNPTNPTPTIKPKPTTTTTTTLPAPVKLGTTCTREVTRGRYETYMGYVSLQPDTASIDPTSDYGRFDIIQTSPQPSKIIPLPKIFPYRASYFDKFQPYSFTDGDIFVIRRLGKTSTIDNSTAQRCRYDCPILERDWRCVTYQTTTTTSLKPKPT